MFRRAFWRMGVAGLEGSINSDSVYVLARDSSDNVILGTCASSATPSGAGYAIGCILIFTSGGNAGRIATNVGTASIAIFQVVSGGTAPTGATA